MPESSLATYRPVFVWWIALVQQIFLQLFCAIWITSLFGKSIADFYVWMVGRPTTVAGILSPFIITFTVAVLGTMVVVIVSRAVNYRTTSYRLYPDRIEIEEGFLTLHAKRLMFRDVREVSLRRGMLQRSVGLGSVYIATQATGTFVSWNPFDLLRSTFGSGAMIRDISDAGEAYERLRSLVDDARRD